MDLFGSPLFWVMYCMLLSPIQVKSSTVIIISEHMIHILIIVISALQWFEIFLQKQKRKSFNITIQILKHLLTKICLDLSPLRPSILIPSPADLRRENFCQASCIECVTLMAFHCIAVPFVLHRRRRRKKHFHQSCFTKKEQGSQVRVER